MRKSMSALLTALLLVGGAANLAFVDPGPNGNNEKGLCTAYFNGQKNGHEKQKDKNGEYPGPFAGLEEEAGDADGDGESGTPEDVYRFCIDLLGEDGIGGNPDDNGRWTCYEDPQEDNEDNVTCDDNPEPGNSGNKGNGNG